MRPWYLLTPNMRHFSEPALWHQLGVQQLHVILTLSLRASPEPTVWVHFTWAHTGSISVLFAARIPSSDNRAHFFSKATPIHPMGFGHMATFPRPGWVVQEWVACLGLWMNGGALEKRGFFSPDGANPGAPCGLRKSQQRGRQNQRQRERQASKLKVKFPLHTSVCQWIYFFL